MQVPPDTTLDAALPLFERDDTCLRAGLIEGFVWLSHLDLLETGGD
jgi:hypothetical protein